MGKADFQNLLVAKEESQLYFRSGQQRIAQVRFSVIRIITHKCVLRLMNCRVWY